LLRGCGAGGTCATTLQIAFPGPGYAGPRFLNERLLPFIEIDFPRSLLPELRFSFSTTVSDAR
ncbi:MAG: hypothetical protein ACPGES_13320, partial [Coraliomargarita sp.]